MRKSITLTAALEDYLEAIYHLCRRGQSAHSRDIAETLSVHKSTVTAALRSLGHMGLVNYAPYEAVTLTAKGSRLAEDVVDRHEALRDFFIDVLMVDAGVAETAACGMEHAIPRVIVEKLADFAHFIRNCPRGGGKWADDSASGREGGSVDARECAVCAEKRDGVRALEAEGGRAATGEAVTLDLVAPGGRAVVVSFSGDSATERRIAGMGVTKGAVVEVDQAAPPGDPLDILLVKGCRLSLRKGEAAQVLVKRIGR